MSNADKNFLVYRASAGSGKTYTIALQYIAQLLQGVSHRQILAVTFTNDATGEMKERIIEKLYDLANRLDADFLKSIKEKLPENLQKDDEIAKKAAAALTHILHDYSRFHVTTIDSFFQQVVRNLAKELGVGSRFDIELNIDLPVKEAVKSLISEADEKELNKLTQYVEHKLEDGKSWKIDKDLQDFGKNIFKEAFQKNQKKIEDDFENNPDKIENARKECWAIKKEFERNIVEFIDAFDETNKNLLDNYLNTLDLGLSESGRRITVKSSNIETYYKELRKDYKATPTSDGVIALYNYMNENQIDDFEFLKLFSFHKNNLPRYNSADIFLTFIHQLVLLEHIAKKVSKHDEEQNRFILAGTNQLLSGLIGEGDAPFVFEKIGAQIQSVVIDEFQDTSELQWRNFKVLISETLANNHFGMLVGDVKQSIYRWRGGDWKILNDITDTELREHIGDKTLDTNFRSAKTIVEFNNQLFEKAASGLCEPVQKAYKDIVQKQKKEAIGFVSVDFVKKKDNSWKETDGSNRMINWIAEKIKHLVSNGVLESDICILCRNNKQIREIAAAVPNIISEDAYVFGSSPALQMIIAALQIINEPANLAAAAELEFLLKRRKIEEINKKQLQERVKNTIDIEYSGLYDLCEKLCRKFDLTQKPEHAPFLFAFMDKLTDYISRNQSDIGRFLDYWDGKMSQETLPVPTGKEDARTGILAITIHKSKGLQFHTVIVPFVDWGMADKSSGFKQNIVWCEDNRENPREFPFDFALLPVEYSSKMENSVFADAFKNETENLQMDNLNVLYVALTRAEKNLVVIAQEPSLTQNNNKNIHDILHQSLFAEIVDEHYEKGVIEKSKENGTAGKNSIAIEFNPQSHLINLYLSTEARLFASGDNKYKSGKIKDGNIIHKIFENMLPNEKRGAAIATAVAHMVAQGEISEAERTKYTDEIAHFFENQKYKNFFDRFFAPDQFERMNECSILIENSKTLRPDCVLINNANKIAVVIDFKTGEEEEYHKKQVGEYKNLLKNMTGYSVIGELWYISKNKIEEVNL
jgi:ATP-dependent exoDNAse (exonuclease V) beta subunit